MTPWPPTDPARLRLQITAMQARAAAVAERFERVGASGIGDVSTVDHRCEQGSCTRLLAKVFLTNEGMMFVSDIRWLSSDALTLQPWDRDAFLLGSDPSSLTDEHLAGFADLLLRWEQGRLVQKYDGPRLPLKRAHWYVREVLDLDRHQEGARGLWVRCHDHPADAEEVDPERLLTAARRERARH